MQTPIPATKVTQNTPAACGSAHITLLRLREVLQRVGICRAQVYAMMANGTFPKPLKITSKAVRWPDTHIDAWINARIAEGGAA